jgi:hypothetical protein
VKTLSERRETASKSEPEGTEVSGPAERMKECEHSGILSTNAQQSQAMRNIPHTKHSKREVRRYRKA